ncbi:MAG: DUF983 domain-containing protein [Bacteroidetes bacterium]|nr:MAG: DUF983 domain-containing protein [Bacteroidota bacterium]
MKSPKLYSILKGKCPVCLKGDVFKSSKAYRIREFDKMHENCSHCGHKYEIEQGFWYGAMYVSYALTVAISVFCFVVTYLLFPNAHSGVFIGVIAAALILMAPITYRASRMVWMNFFSKYNPKFGKHESVSGNH